jgi:hypothetical protein
MVEVSCLPFVLSAMQMESSQVSLETNRVHATTFSTTSTDYGLLVLVPGLLDTGFWT